MEVSIPANVRSWIYIIGIIGQPIVVYLVDKGLIGTTELALWGALVAAAFALARLNIPAKEHEA